MDTERLILITVESTRNEGKSLKERRNFSTRLYSINKTLTLLLSILTS